MALLKKFRCIVSLLAIGEPMPRLTRVVASIKEGAMGGSSGNSLFTCRLKTGELWSLMFPYGPFFPTQLSALLQIKVVFMFTKRMVGFGLVQKRNTRSKGKNVLNY